MTEILHANVETTILEQIKDHNGIGQKEFIKIICAIHPEVTPVIVSGIMFRMTKRKTLFRTRVHENATVLGSYLVFAEPQAGADHADRIMRRSTRRKYEPRADSPLCKNCGGAWADHNHKMYCPEEKAPKAPKAPKADAAPPTVHPTVHPTRKPGTFTVNLELPSGKTEPFTLDEMMRMYSQIGRIVESFRTAGL